MDLILDVNAVILRLQLKVALLRPFNSFGIFDLWLFFRCVYYIPVDLIPPVGSVADDTIEVSITMHRLSCQKLEPSEKFACRINIREQLDILSYCNKTGLILSTSIITF